MKKIFLIIMLKFLGLPAMVFSQTLWTPVTSEVSFQIKNTGVTVTGRFTGLKTKLAFDPADLAKSSLEASVDVATIKTGIDKRDRDLLEENYFDAAKYKQIEIRSSKLYKKGSQYAGLFNVTIKGVTKQVEIPFDFNKTGNEATFKGSFNLNRRDFGVVMCVLKFPFINTAHIVLDT